MSEHLCQSCSFSSSSLAFSSSSLAIFSCGFSFVKPVGVAGSLSEDDEEIRLSLITHLFVGFDLERVVSLRGFGGGGGFCDLGGFLRGAGTAEEEGVTPRGGRRENEARLFTVSESGSLNGFLGGTGTAEEECVTSRGGRRENEARVFTVSDSGSLKGFLGGTGTAEEECVTPRGGRRGDEVAIFSVLDSSEGEVRIGMFL